MIAQAFKLPRQVAQSNRAATHCAGVTLVRAILGAVFVFLSVTVIQLFGKDQGYKTSIDVEWIVNAVMFVTAFGALPVVLAGATPTPTTTTASDDGFLPL